MDRISRDKEIKFFKGLKKALEHSKDIPQNCSS
jgi:hypothetical protein